MEQLLEKLKTQHNATDDELRFLIEYEGEAAALYAAADEVRRAQYGTAVYLRGLIEFTNACGNNCYYCGIRRDNKRAERYCLTTDEILSACHSGYVLGFRTFVLQGGENTGDTDAFICSTVRRIKAELPDCAVTLSIGEKSHESYQAYFDAGADRYLLRHETATETHYQKLHPAEMSLANRKRCLFDLKDIGFQVGAGFMVGSPYQTTTELIADLRFLQQLQPDMIGIGPFIPHHETPFANQPAGTLELTLRLLSILRLLFPYVLLPATTALGTISPIGRELGLKAGANVMMPNLTPSRGRRNYALYDNKVNMDEEAIKTQKGLEQRMIQAGYHAVVSRGDVKRR